MDKIPVKIARLLKKYIEKLEENRIPIRQAVLFGSYATGGSHEWSDIDIALVSDVFEGIRIKDRGKIRKITLDISSDLSPLPFRPEQFTLQDPFVREIIEHGIIIKEAQIA
jgi:predicted nucleotidyltransferase